MGEGLQTRPCIAGDFARVSGSDLEVLGPKVNTLVTHSFPGL